MQTGLLQDIFERLSGVFAGLAPEQQTAGRCAGNLDEMVEHVVDGVSSRLRAVPGYARSLRGPLASTFRYIDRMVEAIPGPLPCCRSAFSDDPRINAFFVSPQHIQEVFSQSREVRDLFEANPLAGECWALMCARQQERAQIGMAMVDGQVRKDVLQTVVSFTDHQLHSPGTDEATARCALKCCMFNGLLAHIRRRANDALSRAADLDHRIALSYRRLRDLGQDPAHEPARGELRAELGRLQDQLKEDGLRLPTLNDHLRFVADSLSHPESFLRTETRSMRLSRMAVKLDLGSDESGYELTLPEIHIASHVPRISTLVRFPREELLPEKDFLKEAELFLSF
jgi:hypothetical protein